MSQRDRLRIAVQKSGRLSEPSQELLGKCGLKFRQSRDKLFCFGETLAVDLLLVRDDDIPGLIADGVCDLGIVGRNVYAEQRLGFEAERGARLAELRGLGFGACRLSIAVPQDEPYESPADLAGKRIATSYPNLLGDFLKRNNVDASVVVLNGSVEIAPRLGTADVICDLVQSGGTLVANQLREAARIFDTEAVLVGTTRELADARGELAELLLRRLDGVLAVKDAKLLLFRTRRDAWAAVRDQLPLGAEAQTTVLVDSPDVLAVQSLCTGSVSWTQLESLKRAGASALLVLPVERMLA